MAGAYGVVYRPNPCTCGHDIAVHTPNCTICPTAHAFSADPPTIATSNALANGQRNG
jgi:hypothetical protein